MSNTNPVDPLVIAFHESGHAIVMQLHDPIYVPTGLYLSEPGSNRPPGRIDYCSANRHISLSADNVLGRIAYLLAGRASEMIQYQEDHGGSAGDLAAATEAAAAFGDAETLLTEGEALAVEALQINSDLLVDMAHDLAEKGELYGNDLSQWLEKVKSN